VLLRLADADVLPFEFESFAETVTRYVDEIVTMTDEMREETERTTLLIADDRYVLAADPTTTYVPPTAQDPVPHLNFAPLRNILTRLEASAEAYGDALDPAAMARLSTADQRALDQILIRTERVLTRNEGLPGRPWFKHQIYAPGFYTGYSVKTIPGVREAIEQRDWQLATTQIGHAADALERFADQIDLATEILSASR